MRGDVICRPDGAEDCFGFGSTNMPRLTALGVVWETVLGATLEAATGTTHSPAKTRPKAVFRSGEGEAGDGAGAGLLKLDAAPAQAAVSIQAVCD